MTSEGAVIPPPIPSAKDAITVTDAGQEQQPGSNVGDQEEVLGVKNNSGGSDSGAAPGASDMSDVPLAAETEIVRSGGDTAGADAAAAAEGEEVQAKSKRPPRVGSVRQGRKEKRRAGWEAKKALIKEKKRAERERREEAMRKEGLEIPTAGVDYRALPKEQWSVSQRIRDAKRQEFEALSTGGGYRVCFDMAFDDLMLEKAQASLVQQVLYAYGSNRKAAQPCRMTLSGMRPVMTAKVNKLQGFDTWLGVATDSRCYTEIFEKEELVYLSADAPHTITQLEKGKVYIIGGLVDRNSKKRLCFDKATGQGIKSVRLPLKQESLHGSHSKVLATNHVFDILLRAMAAGGDLQNVEMKALPPRKRAGWTGGDDRGSSSKPINQQTDAEGASEANSEVAPKGKNSSDAEQNSADKSDRPCIVASGTADTSEEEAGERAEGTELSAGGSVAGSSGVSKSGQGRAKEAVGAGVEQKGSGMDSPVVGGTGHCSSKVGVAVKVEKREATSPDRVGNGSKNGAKRAVEGKRGESPAFIADSKRPKTESQGDRLE